MIAVAFYERTTFGLLILAPIPLYVFFTYILSTKIAKGQAKLNNGDIVLVEGQVNVYKSELEVIAKSISKEK